MFGDEVVRNRCSLAFCICLLLELPGSVWAEPEDQIIDPSGQASSQNIRLMDCLEEELAKTAVSDESDAEGTARSAPQTGSGPWIQSNVARVLQAFPQRQMQDAREAWDLLQRLRAAECDYDRELIILERRSRKFVKSTTPPGAAANLLMLRVDRVLSRGADGERFRSGWHDIPLIPESLDPHGLAAALKYEMVDERIRRAVEGVRDWTTRRLIARDAAMQQPAYVETKEAERLLRGRLSKEKLDLLDQPVTDGKSAMRVLLDGLSTDSGKRWIKVQDLDAFLAGLARPRK